MNTDKIILIEETNQKFTNSETRPGNDEQSKFTIFQILSNNIIKNFPSNSVRASSKNVVSNILAYNISNNGKSQMISNITKNQENQTICIKQNSSIIPELTSKNKLKIKLPVQVSVNFFFESQKISFIPTQSLFILKSTQALPEFYSISQSIVDLESKFYSMSVEKLLYNMLKKELVTRKVPKFQDNPPKLSFEETRKGLSILKRLKIEVSIRKSVIKLNFIILLDNYRQLLPASLSYLDTYLAFINQNVHTGQFYYIDNMVHYYTSFHSSLITRVNMSFYTLIQKDLGFIFSFYSQFKQFFMLKSENSLENFFVRATLKNDSELLYVKKEMKLSPSEYVQEQKIKEILDKSTDLFFNNRFQHKQIAFSSNYLVNYPVNTQAEDFCSFAQEFSNLVIESVFSLIEELKKLNLKFINDQFPMQHFKWYEEKPIFIYSVPLCQILEPIEDLKNEKKMLIDEDMDLDESVEQVSEIKENFFFQIIQYHSDSIEKRYLLYTLDEIVNVCRDYELIYLPENIAKGRFSLYNSLSGPGVRKYRGLCRVGNKTLLIASKSFSKTFKSQLFTNAEILNILYQLLNFIRFFTLKNTFFACFDPECLGFNKKGELNFEIRVAEEVQIDFKAFEVLHGRSHRQSLLFSFAKVAEYCFIMQFCVEQGLAPEKIDVVSVLQEIYKITPWLSDLVQGCTEIKVIKRWKLETVHEYLNQFL